MQKNKIKYCEVYSFLVFAQGSYDIWNFCKGSFGIGLSLGENENLKIFQCLVQVLSI